MKKMNTEKLLYKFKKNLDTVELSNVDKEKLMEMVRNKYTLLEKDQIEK